MRRHSIATWQGRRLTSQQLALALQLLPPLSLLPLPAEGDSTEGQQCRILRRPAAQLGLACPKARSGHALPPRMTPAKHLQARSIRFDATLQKKERPLAPRLLPRGPPARPGPAHGQAPMFGTAKVQLVRSQASTHLRSASSFLRASSSASRRSSSSSCKHRDTPAYVPVEPTCRSYEARQPRHTIAGSRFTANRADHHGLHAAEACWLPSEHPGSRFRVGRETSTAPLSLTRRPAAPPPAAQPALAPCAAHPPHLPSSHTRNIKPKRANKPMPSAHSPGAAAPLPAALPPPGPCAAPPALPACVAPQPTPWARPWPCPWQQGQPLQGGC